MNTNKILKGKRICKTFKGGIYEEISMLRLSIWASYVLNNQSDFSEEQIARANIIVAQMLDLNEVIEGLIANDNS